MSDFGGHIRELVEVPEVLLDALMDKLGQAVSANPRFWDEQDAVKPNKFGVFRDTVQHVVFSFPETYGQHTQAKLYPLWEEWKDVLEPIISHVVKYYGYEKAKTTRIMLAKLRKGGVIAKHIDGDESSRVPHKIHVPLVTNDRVEFWQEDSVYYLKPGFATEVNNRIRHGGKNGGDEDRVNLIFDCWDGSI